MDGFYTESSASAVRARRRCYERLLGLWGLSPWPLDGDKVVYLAADLKAFKYRSAANVLSQIRVDAELRGQDLPVSLHL